MNIQIGLAQMTPKLGDIADNLARHLEIIEQSLAQKLDLVVFPELSLTGYRLRDLAFEVAIEASADHPILAPLVAASEKIDMVVGFVEADQRQKFHISSAYLSQGEIVHVHRKVYLPTYGMFDEGRYFAWGDSIAAFDTRFGRIAMLICEDFWHVSPPYLAWLDGADILLFTSASPGRGLTDEERVGSARWVEQVTQAYANLFTNFVVHVNRTGFEDGVTFWGGSAAYDPDGLILAQAPYYEEALVTATLDLSQLRRTRVRLPLLRDERTALTQRTLTRILDDGWNNGR